MRRHFALFALFVLAAAAVSAKDKAPEPRAFEMTVVDPAGAPIPGVSIVVKGSAGEPVELTAGGITDGTGKATGSFPDSLGSYTADLSKDRFRPQHQTLNLAAQKLGKGDTAIIQFTLEPMTALDDYAVAVKAIQAKDMAAAEASLKTAVANDPSFVKGHEVLAMLQLDQKRWDEALASADKTLALDAENVSAMRSRYDALTGLGKTAEADAVLTELAAREKSPDVARLLYNAGAHAMSAKEHDRSRTLLTEALAIDPNLYQAHAGLAELAIADKNYAEAVKQLDLVIGIAPRNFKAYERKIEVLKADKKLKEAADVEAELARKRTES
jgi:Tfp pilus assembly protein PilF